MTAAISNRGDAMACVEQVVDRVAREYRLSNDVQTDLRIALDEVVTNILKYAYADERAHEFTIRCELREGALETTIEDDGLAFDPLLAPAPDLSAPVATRHVGGLGVHFVKNLMSAVRYERIQGRNRLTLSQRIDAGGSR